MPLFDYVCEDCGHEFEMVLPVSEYDAQQYCEQCGGTAKKIITKGHGGIFRANDSIPWVRSVSDVLTDRNGNPANIETIQDLRQYYRDNPNIIPQESHPLLPSSLGDAYDNRPDLERQKKERTKKGNELLRKMRSINVVGRPDTGANTAPVAP